MNRRGLDETQVAVGVAEFLFAAFGFGSGPDGERGSQSFGDVLIEAVGCHALNGDVAQLRQDDALQFVVTAGTGGRRVPWKSGDLVLVGDVAEGCGTFFFARPDSPEAKFLVAQLGGQLALIASAKILASAVGIFGDGALAEVDDPASVPELVNSHMRSRNLG